MNEKHDLETSSADERLLARAAELERKETDLLERERSYGLLLESLPQAVFEVDVEGRITYVNPRGREMFGYGPGDIEPGVYVVDITDPVDHERITRQIEEMAGGRSTGGSEEYLARRKDGSTFPCVIYSSLVTGADGGPAGIRGILTDITDQKDMARALREEKEFSDNIGNALNDIFYVLSVEKGGLLVRWNRACSELSGYSDEELAGMTVFDFFDTGGRQAQEEFLGRLMAEGSASLEAVAIRKDGSRKPYHFSSTLIRDDEGNPLYVAGIGRDMSELIAARESLRESEERYRQIFDHATEGIFQSTLEGNLKSVNPAFARMYGYGSPERLREELADGTIDLYFDPAERGEVIRRLLEDGAVAGMDVRFKRRDGSPMWITLNAHVVRDTGGRILYLEGTTTDISERKEAEERLRLTQFEVDRVLDQVVRVNADGRIAYANEAAGLAFGYSPEEMLDLDIWDITRNFPLEGWKELFDVSRVMETYSIEISAIHRDGASFPVEARISHILFAGSEYIVIAGRDVTERRRAEQQTERLNEELSAINKELSDFAYVVSHDLKAPLRGISSLATWISEDYRDVLDEAGRNQLDLLLDRARRMEKLIESILQYSRSGRLTESKEPVDLGRAAREAIELLGPLGDVTVDVEEGLPRVTCERTRMGQVFANLIGNAVKYMDHPGGHVTVSSTRDGDFWRVSVSDDGPGIDPRYHEQIFGLFQCLDPERDADSTGVGLTLVKKIVELHGGKVWAESEPGRGAAFHFTLPAGEEPCPA